MFDSLPIHPQRSLGEAAVNLQLRKGRVALQGLRQAGSAKVILPRVDGVVPEVVFLNTAGGLTGGDRFHYDLTLGVGCHAVATTQTAERGYASADGWAEVGFHFDVGSGARLDWVPQETILFQGAALHRTTLIDLASDARCLFAESVVLGRAAMGETVTTLQFRDHRTIRRAGRPVLVDPVALDGASLAAGHRPAMLGRNRAFATVALVAQGAEDAVNALRALLDEPGVEGAASGFDGKCIVRLLAEDGWPLRRQLMRLLAVLQGGPQPRVWQI